jgi:hypothetical protein
MRWVGHIAQMGEMGNAYNILVGKPEEKRREEKRREEFILKVGWEDADWMHLAQDRDQWKTPVNMVMNLQVP